MLNLLIKFRNYKQKGVHNSLESLVHNILDKHKILYFDSDESFRNSKKSREIFGLMTKRGAS